jgi:hypothetical protein
MEKLNMEILNNEKDLNNFSNYDLVCFENLFLYANCEVICELVQDAIKTQSLPKIY